MIIPMLLCPITIRVAPQHTYDHALAESAQVTSYPEPLLPWLEV